LQNLKAPNMASGSHQDTSRSYVSVTALGVAYLRSIETQRENAFFTDQFASSLAGEEGKKWLDSLTSSACMVDGIAVRTKVIDELIQLALVKGLEQICVLGAGLDTRPWRLSGSRSCTWYEIDFAEIFQVFLLVQFYRIMIDFMLHYMISTVQERKA